MKLILEFGPDEEAEGRMALNGARAIFALQQFDNRLRSVAKHGKTTADQNFADCWRHTLHDCLAEYEVEIDQ